MKRCRWCRKVVWPWQRSTNRVHVHCWQLIERMVERDEREVRSV